MSNEEELARLKQKCEARIRELRQIHKLEITVKNKEIQDCRQEIAIKNSKIQDYSEQIEYLRTINMIFAQKELIIYNNNEVKSTSESKAMTQTNSNNITARDINQSTLNSEISGIVTNTINQLPASPQSDKPGIKELLTQLQTAIEAETDLSKEDRDEALEQVKTLAEVGTNPQESTMKKAGKKAMTMLKGILAGLPSAATLVEACSKLLPAIASLLLVSAQ
jgi:hypothetical protein